MAPIKNLFHEIKFEILKVVVLNAFLDATLLFLVLLLILSVFSISVIWPLGVAIIFFAIMIWHYGRRMSLSYIEERNPSVREMLRTAADNRDQDTLMAHALFSEVFDKVRNISSGTFLDFRKLLLKLCGIFAISILLVSLAFFNVNIQKFENPLNAIEEGLGDAWSNIFGSVNETNVNISEDEDIYGEPTLAKLGSEALGITVQQNLNQIDFTNVQAADAGGSVPDSYPADAQAQASQAYTGGLQDITDRKAAAEYSQQINK